MSTSSSKPKLTIEKIETFASTCHALFQRVQHKPWAMLLDTANNRLSDGRYDIIVYDPLATYSYKAINNKGDATFEVFNSAFSLSTPSGDCPFSSLAELHNEFTSQINLARTATNAPQLPYKLGAMGLFSYDINTVTDNIKDALPSQYTLPDIAVGFYNQSLIVDNQTGIVYHCSACHSEQEKKAWLLPFLSDERTLSQSTPAFKLNSPWQSNMSKTEYDAGMQKIDAYLRAGDCYQVNYAQRFSATYTGCEWAAYKALSETNKAPFSAFIRLENAAILSLSPERFLQLKNRKVQTKPIKGTRKRADDPVKDKAMAEELFNSEKDRAENLMIVDLLRNDLSKHCQAFSVQVPALFSVESYSAVHHLVSTVEGELKQDASPFDLLKGAFPGGSITGAPKVRAMQIIQELEPDKRSIYCGSIGYVGIDGDMDTSICIRTVLAEKGELFCWAGGGIVLDSTASNEYQETHDKVARILPILSNYGE
ncbi:aminodeoxychorismate synthase component I [Agaribacter flavus]|uniref:aminodeoxychorismate synthase n=1 Tax=Agaribacter flavus TaxID=1902781 RepID=A0ABV7FLQ5_9ALTE